MALPRPLVLAERAGFSLFVLLTSSYCLLAYIPFTYQQVHQAGLFPWLSTFVRIHGYLYWAALAILAPTIVPDLRRGKTRILTFGFVVFSAGVGILLLWYPLLSRLQNDNRSYVWGLASLLPLAWLAAIDWLGEGRALVWKEPGSSEEARIFRAAWQSAVLVALLYATIFYLRHKDPTAMRFGTGEGIFSLSWTILSHLLLFMTVFVGLFLVHAVAALFRQQPKKEFLFSVVASGLLLAAIIRFLIFRQISFEGRLADLFSLAAGICYAVSYAGLGVKLYPAENDAVESGLALLLTPFRWAGRLSGAARVIPFALIAIAAFFLAVRTAALDWNYLLQKLSVLLVWTAVFANLYDLAGRRAGMGITERQAMGLLLVAVVALGAYRALGLWQPRFYRPAAHRRVNAAAVLDAYAAYDVSFKLADEALSPTPSGSSSFYKFLSQNTNIPRSRPTHPVEVNLVEHLSPGNSPKPNIFIFVIDSLRRDYVSLYNPAVTFTPSIEAFGRESVVMENAFTQYGGTGLSEPAIWVGGMLLHQQYVTPFYPMNALQKLTEAEGYKSFISKDAILSVIVHPSPSIVELDKDTTEKYYDFCKTLDELESKLSSEKDPGVPLFAYSQSQNIHISVIHREGESVPAGETYPGFYAPYASRLKRMDGCMGKFVQFMKKSGLYDKSIIVLTSDHGDSLGEGGRWGHAYTLFPEIVQIPLIIHLPPALRAGVLFNAHAPAFLTDITPSLYYLLGHRAIRRNGIFGRPLFVETPAEEAQYFRNSYLMASSYGPVYGILKNDGHSLYLTDGVNYRDYLYDLPDSLGMSRRVSDSLREENQRAIRNGILAIGRFYQFE